MELQEAINHAREVSDKCSADNRDCAYQHDKLADWLEELKSLRTILGDEYDLERLRELVQADREGRVRIEEKTYQCPKCGAYRLTPRLDKEFYFCFHCKSQVPRAEAERGRASTTEGAGWLIF